MSTLSAQQLAAAHRVGQDVCVVAGPGSGKTSVLIERFSWLVQKNGIDPGRILAITFTDKAATEIKHRLVKAFADQPSVREQIERAYVSTIHSFCTRLLRENAIAACVDPEFRVLDRSSADALLRDVTDAVLEEKFQREPSRTRRFLRSLAVATERDGFVPDLARSLMDIYSGLRVAGRRADSVQLPAHDNTPAWARLRYLLEEVLADRPYLKTQKQEDEHGLFNDWARAVLAVPALASPEQFKLFSQPKFHKGRLCKTSVAYKYRDAVCEAVESLTAGLLLEYYADERALIVEILRLVDQEYRNQKRAVSGLDFDDLEEQAIALLENNPPLRRRIQQSFDHILMDELQDTNPLQWKLMGLVRRPDNFFAVGDVNQSIFGFRHAEPRLFHDFRKQLEMEGKPIDELRDNWRSRAEVVAAVNTTFEGPPNGVEAHTLLAASSAFGPKAVPSVETIAARAEKTDEAQRLEALWVAKRITELVTGPVRFRDIAVLTRSNIATGELQAALDAFDIPSIVLGGLIFFETREVRDLVLLLEVLVNPCNEVALAGLLRSPLFGYNDEDLLRLCLKGCLSEAADLPVIRELRVIRDLVSPDRLLRRVIDESDYESGLTSRGRANVEKLLAILRTQYTTSPAPLAEVLRWVRNAAPDAEAPPSDFGDAVRLMTIHKSKGLEFPIVFLPFLHASRGSGFPIVSYSLEYGLGVKWRHPHTREPIGDLIWTRNESACKQWSNAEENRLLYVAMTRAKEHMVLSYSNIARGSSSTWRSLIMDRIGAAEEHFAAPKIVPVTSASAAQSFTFIDPVHATGQHDASESVTSISLFQQCPRKYYLTRYLRWESPGVYRVEEEPEFPEPDSGELDGSELGIQVHQILAKQLVDRPSPEAVELADRFRTSALGKRAEKAVRKGYENDFVMAVEGIVLRGQIDLWFEHNRELVLVDYKTDRLKVPIPPERIEGYEIQLQMYAMALDRMLGRMPDRAYLYFLRPDVPVEIDLSPLQLHGARAAVREFLHAQEHMEFPVRPGDHCYRCPHYQQMCTIEVPELAYAYRD